MRSDVEVLDGPAEVARAAADYVARRARASVEDHDRFHFAVSGGHTPWQMFAELAAEEVPWAQVVLYQVDERVAPDGDPARNLTHLRESLGDAPAEVRAMPVGAADLHDAADVVRRAAARSLRPHPPRARARRAHGIAGAR